MTDRPAARPFPAGATVVLVVALLGAACGSSRTGADPPPPSPPSSAVEEAALTPATVSPSVETPPSWPATLPEGEPSRQAVVVTAAGYGEAVATLSGYERTGAGWELVFGPLDARIGAAGFAPPGEKREGDGRTPSGVFGFDFFFGMEADPGVRFPYRQVTSESIVWDVNPDSPLYNTWVDRAEQGEDFDPELQFPPLSYDYAAVIGYNAERVPGLGSAIFLHSIVEETTIGCVSLPVTDLVPVLRWLDPAQQPRIVMGVAERG